MWICPVCDTTNKTSERCVRCGFDNSTNCEKYPTFSLVHGKKTKTVSQQREKWLGKEHRDDIITTKSRSKKFNPISFFSGFSVGIFVMIIMIIVFRIILTNNVTTTGDKSFYDNSTLTDTVQQDNIDITSGQISTSEQPSDTETMLTDVVAGVFWPNLSDEATDSFKRSIDNEFDNAGFTYTDFDSGSSQYIQNDQIDYALTMGINLLIVSVVDADTDVFLVICDTANSCDIPIIFFDISGNLDREVPDSVIDSYDNACFVTISNSVIGSEFGLAETICTLAKNIQHGNKIFFGAEDLFNVDENCAKIRVPYEIEITD